MLTVTSVVGGLHGVLLLFILPISLLALLTGYFRSKDRLAFVLGLAGLTQLGAIALLGSGFLSELSEGVLTTIGRLALVLGHFRNRQMSSRNTCEDEHCS